MVGRAPREPGVLLTTWGADGYRQRCVGVRIPGKGVCWESQQGKVAAGVDLKCKRSTKTSIKKRLNQIRAVFQLDGPC